MYGNYTTPDNRAMEPIVTNRTPLLTPHRPDKGLSAYFSWRLWCWQVMAGPTSDVSQSNFPAKVVEVTSLTLIVVNAVLIAIDSSTPDSSVFDRCYFFFELLSVAFFSLEYALRLWTAVEEAEYAAPLHGRVRWALSPLNLLDLMALLPYVVDLALPDNPGGNKFRGGTAIGLVRLLRLFVLLRLERKFTAFARIHAVLRHKGEELLVTAFIALIMLVTSSSMVYYIENPSNDTFSDIPTAMWWAVTALTTVGYGDICPMTPMGRFFGAITAFVGVGFFAMPAGIISSGFVEAMMDEKRSKVCQA